MTRIRSAGGRTYKTADGKELLPLGGDGPLQRDELLRLLAGGQVSLAIAFIATMIALLIGVILGTLSGYFAGGVDAVISRITELFMSFPLLLLVIALGQTAAQRLQSWTLHGLFQPGVLGLAVVIGLFAWFYPARSCGRSCCRCVSRSSSRPRT